MSKKRLKRSTYFLLAMAIVTWLPQRTLGWGNRGHQVIARIAMARLSTSARQAISELLEPGETLESVSTWADQIKTERPETKTWHVVSIPLSDTRYVRAKGCGRNEVCIIEAIAEQMKVLKDSSKDSYQRAQALKFLVHLIGDLHQPFHVTTNTKPEDLGANRVRVTSLSGRSTNLHDVWDTDLVETGLKRSARSVGDYATQLTKGSTSAGQTNRGGFTSTAGSVTDWALEAHRLAWGGYYDSNGQFMWDQTRVSTLDQRYYDKNVPVVEGQLTRAGARLAKILNDIFNVRSSAR
jgi:S1/P1 Nuclease